MARPEIAPTGREVFFDKNDIIVSKTDTAGRMTYANDVFLSISGYQEREILGVSHNMIRHPDMPRSVFALLWETISTGEEIFVFVKNMTRNGDHYWGFAHVTPSFDDTGKIIAYHSNRRVTERAALAKIEPLYKTVLSVEKAAPGPREALAAGKDVLTRTITASGLSYPAFIFSL